MKNTEGEFILSDISEAKPSAAASGCTSISDSRPIYVRIFSNPLTYVVATQHAQCSFTGGHLLTPLGATVFTGPSFST